MSAAPSWDKVLLVCKQCRKRSDGPKEPKAKALVGALKRAVREERPRPRVLLTSCLGLCPKRATAVAHVGGKGGEVRLEPIASVDDMVEMARR